jgi:hypothetical protein
MIRGLMRIVLIIGVISVGAAAHARPAAAAIGGSCAFCASDDLGHFCVGNNSTGYNGCIEDDNFINGNLVGSSCSQVGGQCGFYMAQVSPDGSARNPASRSIPQRQRLINGEFVFRDCSGAIVGREMSAERATGMRQELTSISVQ